MTTDRFGIPDSIFGIHGDDFYGGIGRVAVLSALIEHQALGILQTMTSSLQSEHSRLPANQLIDKACKTLNSINDCESRTVLLSYFNDIEAALRRRNDYIHSLWPAKPEGRLYGWRAGRRKNVPTEWQYEALETNMNELEELISTLVELVKRRNSVHPAALILRQVVR